MSRPVSILIYRVCLEDSFEKFPPIKSSTERRNWKVKEHKSGSYSHTTDLDDDGRTLLLHWNSHP